MKEILLALVNEVENLRANLAVQARYVPAPPTTAEAREAKGLALKESSEFFDTLRKQIEGLA
jgi:hypothetical protein